MGSIIGKTTQNVDYINHFNEIKLKCEKYKNDQKELLNIFRSEFNIVINNWNSGTLCKYDFDTVTHIIGYIKDKHLFILYNSFLEKWNDGNLKTRDLNVITTYLKRFC